MPYGDGRGPAGLGPMTGRAAGYCAGYSVPGYMNFVPGRGYYGRGGRGYRNWYYATGLPGWMRSSQGLPPWENRVPMYKQEITPKEEADMLKEQSEYLKQELDSIQERISILEKKTKEEKK